MSVHAVTTYILETPMANLITAIIGIAIVAVLYIVIAIWVAKTFKENLQYPDEFISKVVNRLPFVFGVAAMLTFSIVWPLYGALLFVRWVALLIGKNLYRVAFKPFADLIEAARAKAALRS